MLDSAIAFDPDQLHQHRPVEHQDKVFELRDVSVYYGDTKAVSGVSLDVYRGNITAVIGPSGCGKSTLLRSFNRMNDLIPGARVEGSVRYRDADVYDRSVNPVQVRRTIGMVFQKPNPFPKSIYDNVAFGPRTLRMTENMDDLVESALRDAALWDEVKDRLHSNAYGMSGGQQQRLCIARAIATKPEVVLMDEPCSALDTVATGRIEDLMLRLKEEYSIVIVTHNMQQAARVSDMTAFLMVSDDADEQHRWGELVEYDDTSKIFTAPADRRTDEYVTGRIG